MIAVMTVMTAHHTYDISKSVTVIIALLVLHQGRWWGFGGMRVEGIGIIRATSSIHQTVHKWYIKYIYTYDTKHMHGEMSDIEHPCQLIQSYNALLAPLLSSTTDSFCNPLMCLNIFSCIYHEIIKVRIYTRVHTYLCCSSKVDVAKVNILRRK